MFRFSTICVLVFTGISLGQEADVKSKFIYPIEVRVTKDTVTLTCVENMEVSYDPGKGIVETKTKKFAIRRPEGLKKIAAVGGLALGKTVVVWLSNETLRIECDANHFYVRLELPE